MRLKIKVKLEKTGDIPFNYQYQLHAALYQIIRKSSLDYSTFLHDTGFIDEKKNLKLFTFSRCYFKDIKLTKYGFSKVNQFQFYFSTPIEKSLEHLVLGIFSDQTFSLQFGKNKFTCYIEHVETMKEPEFKNEMKFLCLSPVAIASNDEKYSGKHYLDYMNPDERAGFVEGIKLNLMRKYKLVAKENLKSNSFDFSFDPEYIIKRQGKIKKNIKFKNNRIIAMDAPFTISTNPELIKIGYECGLGSENSAGFGMIGII